MSTKVPVKPVIPSRKKCKRPEVRKLKICEFGRMDSNKICQKVPEIRLSGKWLQKLGFVPNKNVNVTLLNNMIVIQLEELQEAV